MHLEHAVPDQQPVSVQAVEREASAGDVRADVSEGVCVEASGKAQGCVVLLVECECADVGQGRAYYESREE